MTHTSDRDQELGGPPGAIPATTPKSAVTEAETAAAHTPGPWQMSGGRRSDVIYGHSVGPDGAPYIAAIPYSDRTPEEHRASLADARLISAAPDLLAVARMVAEASEAAGFSGPLGHAARAALAKATGR